MIKAWQDESNANEYLVYSMMVKAAENGFDHVDRYGMSRSVGLAPSTCTKHMDSLVSAGIANRWWTGKEHIYQLNRVE